MKFYEFNLGDGLNVAVNPFQNKDGESRVMQNCDTSSIGVLSKQLGYATYGNNKTNSVKGLYSYTKSSTSTAYWLMVSGTDFFYDNAGTWTDDGNVSNAEMEFTTYLDTCIMVNGIDAPQKFTGSGISALSGSPPTGKYIATYAESVFIANITNNKSRLQWSDTAKIETWTASNYHDFRDDDGDEITGITRNGDNLLVFKNNSLHKFSFNEDGTTSVNEISNSIGCVDNRTIATINNWTFFLSNQGIYAYNGQLVYIGRKVKPFEDGILSYGVCVGIADKNFYYLYIGTSNSVTNCMLIYNYLDNKWSYKNLADVPVTMAIMTTTAGVRTIKFGNNAGQVYTLNFGYADNTTNITMDYETPPLHFKEPNNIKKYNELVVLCNTETKQAVNVYYSIDYKDWDYLGTVYKPVNVLTIPNKNKHHFDNNGYHIRLKFTECSSSETVDIYGYVFDYDLTNKKERK